MKHFTLPKFDPAINVVRRDYATMMTETEALAHYRRTKDHRYEGPATPRERHGGPWDGFGDPE